MSDSTSLLARLRGMAAVGVPARPDDEATDWLAHGLARGRFHEVYGGEEEDAAAAAGFAAALAIAAGATPLVWLRQEAGREAGRLHATGLAELGLAPDRLLLVTAADTPALLRAAADVARCPAVGVLVIESWGAVPGLDLTATRRLVLAAEASGVTVVSLRCRADPVASAAATRWRVAATASTALDADAPGAPAFSVELLRRRGGPAGARWRVEWNRERRCFEPQTSADASVVPPPLQAGAAPMAGAGVSVAVG